MQLTCSTKRCKILADVGTFDKIYLNIAKFHANADFTTYCYTTYCTKNEVFHLNVFFKKKAERFVGQNATTDDDILSHIDSLTSSHDSFKLQRSNMQ